LSSTSQTVWSTIQRAEAGAGTDEPESVRWEDLDWSRLSSTHATAPTGLCDRSQLVV
jgi:hypothetical protein